MQLTRQTVDARYDLGFDRALPRGANQRGRMRFAHKVAVIATIMGFGLLPMAAPALATEATVVTVSEAVASSAALKARSAALTAKTWKFAFVSPVTLDRSGVQPSLYRGKFYRPSLERIRRCIVSRESSGHYFSVSHSGKYRGAYQMSPALARGVTWMMFPEFQKILGEKAAEVAMLRLRNTPIHKWTRFWQDAAFSTVYNWEHPNSGASHWRATNRGC